MGEAAVCNLPDDPRFSRPLDVKLFSNYKEFNGALGRITDKVKGDLGQGYTRDKKTYRRHLKTIILDLFEAWSEHRLLYLAYSRNEASYGQGKRLHKLHMRYGPLLNCINALEKHGYLKTRIGFKDRLTEKGYQSRMRASSELINTLLLHDFERQMIERANDGPIILRDKEHNDVEFAMNSTLERKRANMNKINAYLDEQEISFDPPKEAISDMWNRKIVIPNMNRSQIVRIFNESFSDGGRFYRHWSLGLPSEYRRYIRINGERVTEIDYDSIHPFLLYAMRGLPMPDGDMYEVDGMQEGNKGQRKICKTILLSAFNVKPWQNLEYVVMKALHEKDIYPKGNEVQHLIDGLKERHRPIKNYFASGVGRKLQRKDSDIAERIILRLRGRNVPCLPVHDSFIVPASSREALQEAMIQEARAVTGQFPRVSVKY